MRRKGKASEMYLGEGIFGRAFFGFVLHRLAIGVPKEALVAGVAKLHQLHASSRRGIPQVAFAFTKKGKLLDPKKGENDGQ